MLAYLVTFLEPNVYMDDIADMIFHILQLSIQQHHIQKFRHLC